MSHREVLDLPIGAFWLLNTNIDRILAELDLRALSTANAAQGGEGAQKHREHLLNERGVAVKLNPLEAKPDEGAAATLRMLGG